MEGGALESSHFEDEIPPHVWSQEVRVGGQGAVDVKEGERKRVYVCVINQKLRDANVSKQNHLTRGQMVYLLFTSGVPKNHQLLLKTRVPHTRMYCMFELCRTHRQLVGSPSP